MGGRAGEIGGRVPEFLRILPPDTFISIQSKNRNKHAVSLGDPDRASISDELIKPGPYCGSYRSPVPFESGIMSSFIATLEVDGMGGYNLRPSLTT